MDWSRPGQGQQPGFCEHGNEPSSFIKCGEFPWLGEEMLASQEGLCSMELVR